MNRPAFQFYPGDWQRDAALRSCSIGARGLWVEMICVMHQAEPYGHLVLNGKPIGPAVLARMVGCTPAETARYLAELEAAGVSSKSGEVIISRRMVRDERLRQVRAEGGKAGKEHGIKGAEHGVKGGRPAKETGVNKPPLHDEEEPPLKPPPSSSSSSSSSNQTNQALLPHAERGDAPDSLAEKERKPTRAVALAVLLRKAGVSVTGSHPKALEWADELKVTDKQALAAVEMARLHKPDGSIPVNYLDPILRQVIAEPPAGINGHDVPRWWESEAGTEKQARLLGMWPARGGESWEALRGRMKAKLIEVKNAAAAH